MPIEITRYDITSRDVLIEDEDDTITVANGATHELSNAGFYLLKATGDCRVRCKSGITDATGGRTFYDGDKETRVLRAGVVVACDALN